jgi:hypothetical protein
MRYLSAEINRFFSEEAKMAQFASGGIFSIPAVHFLSFV